MPITPSAKKALRQNRKHRISNSIRKNQIRILLHDAKKAIEQKNQEQAVLISKKAVSAIDKLAQKGILKKNTAARKKSWLMKSLMKAGFPLVQNQ